MDKQVKVKVFNSADFKSLTEAEQTIFRNVIEVLDASGLFNVADVPVIAAYARNVVLARTAAKDVQKLGTVIEFQDRGCTKYKTNPAVDIMNKAQMAYQDTAIKLGLTPTGRKRMKGEGKPKKSALEKFNEEFDD
jgi:P27 family predicted phage terminase small subunit